ncbi:DsbA family oxidoreductase [Aliidiomarina minuta]|uniref:DsbA family oxidoreductase n=1 Tax=Aliidiomarina minuta TaxID=880057 RepID=A0A432W404_9GAMM|nr:DsbA family oxidoreductase [Aliidiomarina minuta]RUO24036.1 DsbA family oxidoreductase [Aliidiomarina minuta]
MTSVHIDIVSDIACPWCAIGYARLEKALQSLQGEVEASVEWHAFELNPDPNQVAEPILPALSKKYGRSEQEMEQAQAQMMEIAVQLGLNFDKMQQRYTCNTFDAHRLLKWAHQFGKQTALKQVLFEAYFGNAEDVSKHSVLLNCVEKAGLDSAEANQILTSGQYQAEVRADEQRYQQAGITAVPAFIINQKYVINGAQESEVLAQTLQQISRETEERG